MPSLAFLTGQCLQLTRDKERYCLPCIVLVTTTKHTQRHALSVAN